MTNQNTYMRDIKKGREVDEAFLAERRHELKMKLFMYRRKKSSWFTLFDSVVKSAVISDISEPDFDRRLQDYLNHWTKTGKTAPINEVNDTEDMILEVRKEGCCRRFTGRTLAILSISWSIIVLETETTLMFDYRATLINTLVSQFHENIWATYMLTIFFVTGMVATSFFTIFKVKFSDYLQLVPGHTDCVTFCSFTSLFSKLISVAGFNFMIMNGEV
jgi:hypothetical protein